MERAPKMGGTHRYPNRNGEGLKGSSMTHKCGAPHRSKKNGGSHSKRLSSCRRFTRVILQRRKNWFSRCFHWVPSSFAEQCKKMHKDACLEGKQQVSEWTKGDLVGAATPNQSKSSSAWAGRKRLKAELEMWSLTCSEDPFFQQALPPLPFALGFVDLPSSHTHPNSKKWTNFSFFFPFSHSTSAFVKGTGVNFGTLTAVGSCVQCVQCLNCPDGPAYSPPTVKCLTETS